MNKQVNNLLDLLEKNLPNANAFKEKIFNKTSYYQKLYGFDIGTGKHSTWNNEADAFKHAFMQSVLTIDYNNYFSKLIGDLHEMNGNINYGQTKGEENMDKWNNRVGRLIAKEIKKEYKDKLKTMTEKEIDDIIAQKVMQRMRMGKLITSPSDKRKYTGFAANLPTDKIFIREDISKLSTDDFEELEDSINEQLSSFGIPTELQAQQAVQNGSLIWVNSYTREDGTQVCGYYRRK